LYFHPQQKTYEQFKEDVGFLINKYLDDIYKKHYNYIIYETDIIRFISDKLVELDYIEAECIIVSIQEYSISPCRLEDVDKDLPSNIINIIGEESFNKLIKYNEEIKEQMDKDLMSKK
jgi:hypothetical protein